MSEAFTHFLVAMNAHDLDECVSILRSSTLPMALQLSYFTCYFAFSQQRPDIAMSVAERFVDYPVARYQKLFRSVVDALNQISVVSDEVKITSDQTRDKYIAAQPSVSMEAVSDGLMLSVVNSATVLLSFYLLDIETMFSTNPFVFNSKQAILSSIVPDKSYTVEVPTNVASFKYPIPPEYTACDMIVTASFSTSSSTNTQSVTVLHHTMVGHVIKEHGLIRAVDSTSMKPLCGVYVKVYSETTDGRTSFYKDGYTDICGCFDYVSLNNMNLKTIKRYSILLRSETNGSVVTEAKPPAN